MDAFTRFLHDIQEEDPGQDVSTAQGLANMDWGQLQQVDESVSQVDPTKVSHVVPIAPRAHVEYQQPYGLTDAEAAIMNKVAGVERAARSMAMAWFEKEAAKPSRAKRKEQAARKQRGEQAKQRSASKKSGGMLSSAPKKTRSASPVIIGGEKPKPSGKIIIPGSSPKPGAVIMRPGPGPKIDAKIEVSRGSNKKTVSGGKLTPELQAAAAKQEAEAVAKRKAPSWARSGGESTVGTNPKPANKPTVKPTLAPTVKPTPAPTPASKPTASTVEKALESTTKSKGPGVWAKYFKGKTKNKALLAGGAAAALGATGYGAYKAFGGKKKAASVDEDNLELAIRQKVAQINWND